MNAKRKIAVLCGSTSDFAQISSGLAMLRVAEAQGLVNILVRVCSAHRNPKELRDLLRDFFLSPPPDVVIMCAGKLAALFGVCDAISRNEFGNATTHFVAVPLKGKTAEASQAAYLSAKEVPNAQFVFKDEFFANPETAFDYAIRGELPAITLAEQKPPQSFTLERAYHAGRRKYPEKASYDNAIEKLEHGGLIHMYTGKTRETFVSPDHPGLLFILATDRISIFDIVMNATIPGKGAILTAMTIHWLENVFPDVPNHLVAFGSGILGYFSSEMFVVNDNDFMTYLMKNMIVVKQTKVLKVEAIVRGYLTGSGLKDYRKTGQVCGMTLPEGLVDGSELPTAIFTPSTKADYGEHDLNISLDEASKIIGEKEAVFVQTTAHNLYLIAKVALLPRGIIVADTKFEFGVDPQGKIILIDEVLTPDSSRFWSQAGRESAMAEGKTPPSFDKQPVRIAGEAAGIKTSNPGWTPSDELIAETASNYSHMFELATSRTLQQFQEQKLGVFE